MQLIASEEIFQKTNIYEYKIFDVGSLLFIILSFWLFMYLFFYLTYYYLFIVYILVVSTPREDFFRFPFIYLSTYLFIFRKVAVAS